MNKGEAPPQYSAPNTAPQYAAPGVPPQYSAPDSTPPYAAPGVPSQYSVPGVVPPIGYIHPMQPHITTTPQYAAPGVPPQYSVPGVVPQPGYIQHMQPQLTTSIGLTMRSGLGPRPQTMKCPSCEERITTEMSIETGTKTHFVAAMLCVVCLCCIPYCFNSCKNRNHYCPNCNAFLGTHIG